MLENPASALPPTYLPGWHQADLVAKMRYTRLGETELMVSQVGFGGCVVGGVYPDKGDLQEIYEVKSEINCGPDCSLGLVPNSKNGSMGLVQIYIIDVWD